MRREKGGYKGFVLVLLGEGFKKWLFTREKTRRWQDWHLVLENMR
jgi:hypothetical protein